MAVRSEVAAEVLILVTAKVTVLVTNALTNCRNVTITGSIKRCTIINAFSYIYSHQPC